MRCNPKVFIVIPSLNQGEFIKGTTLSVLIQGYANFEHIVIDGGSTDGTINILKKYLYLIWISGSDKGRANVSNKRFRMATRELIEWLNADDYFLEGAFNKVVEFYKWDP